jgi:two-component system, NarL family, response regulator
VFFKQAVSFQRIMMETTAPIRVMVVDDYQAVRQGWRALINGEPNMIVVAEAADGERAVELFRRVQPDVVLMDLRLPLMNGCEATRTIRGEFSDARIIILTTFDGDEDIKRSLQAGACAYLLKDVYGDELLMAIRTASAKKFDRGAETATLNNR